MKNEVQAGKVLTVIAPAAVLSGDYVLVGKIGGVAAHDAAQDSEVEIVTEGVFLLAVTGLVAGDRVYRTAGGSLTGTASGNTRIGVAVRDSAAGSTAVKLDAVLS